MNPPPPLSATGLAAPPVYEALLTGSDGVLWSPWVLLVLLAAVALWARRTGAEEDRWHALVDLPLVVVVGVTYAVVTGWLLSPRYIQGGAYGDVDFAAYCDGLGSLRDGTIERWYAKHSPMAGLLLAQPARRIGVLGALTGGAVASSGLFAAGMYLWGRVAAGRIAGLGVVCFAAANQQLLWLGRSPSFYPETTAACILGTAGVAAALRWRTPWTMIAGGFGTGLILTADVRFFTVGVWSCSLLLLAVVAGPVRQLPLRLLMAVLPIAGWWYASRLLHTAVVGEFGKAPGAVAQVWGFVNDVPGFPANLMSGAEIERLDHFWGVDPVTRIPAAMLALMKMSQAIPRDWGDNYNLRFERTCYLDPWVWPVVIATVVATFVLLRRPWQLLAAFAPAVPFAANLLLVFRTIPQARYEVMGMVVVPLALGVGLGALGGLRWARWPALAFTAVLVAATLDLAPSFLSPRAPWRVPVCATNRVYDVYVKATGRGDVVPELVRETGGADVQGCIDALAVDVAADHLWMPFDDTTRRSECGHFFPKAVLELGPDPARGQAPSAPPPPSDLPPPLPDGALPAPL